MWVTYDSVAQLNKALEEEAEAVQQKSKEYQAAWNYIEQACVAITSPMDTELSYNLQQLIGVEP